MTITTNALFELYLDGKKIKSQGSTSDKPVKIDMTVDNGIHQLLIKLLTTKDSLLLSAEIAASGKDSKAVLDWSSNPRRNLSIKDILEGETVSGASLSPSGKFLLINVSEVLPGSGRTQQHSRIYDTELKKNVISLRNTAIRASWLPSTDRLCYQIAKENYSDIYVYDIQNGEESLVATGLKSPSRISWSPDESYFIFSGIAEAAKTGDLKRVFSNEDRIPNSRNRYHLFLYKNLTLED